MVGRVASEISIPNIERLRGGRLLFGQAAMWQRLTETLIARQITDLLKLDLRLLRHQLEVLWLEPDALRHEVAVLRYQPAVQQQSVGGVRTTPAIRVAIAADMRDRQRRSGSPHWLVPRTDLRSRAWPGSIAARIPNFQRFHLAEAN